MNKITIEIMLALGNVIAAVIGFTSKPPYYGLAIFNLCMALVCIAAGIYVYRNVGREYW